MRRVAPNYESLCDSCKVFLGRPPCQSNTLYLSSDLLP